MKNKILSAIVLVAAVIGFSSCNEKWEPGGVGDSDKGTLSTADLAVDLTNAENIIDGRASRASIDLSGFIVTVIDANGVTVNEWKYASMPSLPSFTVGTYTLKVESGKPVKAAWNAPYFVGEKQFSIVKDQVTPAGTVTCKLQNLKVTVRFDKELIDVSAGDLQCEIRVNEDAVLTFDPTTTESGYFEVVPENTTMVATFTGTVYNYKEEIIRLYKDLNPGQHRIITFALKGANITPPVEQGFIDPMGGINVDFSVTDTDLNFNYDADEPTQDDIYKPGHEDWPDKPDDPTPPAVETLISFTSEYLDLSDGNRNSASEFGPAEDGLKPAVVVIGAEKGIAHLYVTIDSESLDVTDVGLRNNFDLAYPGDLESALGPDGLQFPIADQVVNQTSVTFDISQFVPMLALPMFPGQHNFIIEVIDNDGKSKTLKLTFINE